jgi:hypothetical protein
MMNLIFGTREIEAISSNYSDAILAVTGTNPPEITEDKLVALCNALPQRVASRLIERCLNKAYKNGVYDTEAKLMEQDDSNDQG